MTRLPHCRGPLPLVIHWHGDATHTCAGPCRLREGRCPGVGFARTWVSTAPCPWARGTTTTHAAPRKRQPPIAGRRCSPQVTEAAGRRIERDALQQGVLLEGTAWPARRGREPGDGRRRGAAPMCAPIPGGHQPTAPLPLVTWAYQVQRNACYWLREAHSTRRLVGPY